MAKPPDPSWEGAAVVFNREREASAEEESLLVVGEEAGSGIVRGEWKKRKILKRGRQRPRVSEKKGKKMLIEGEGMVLAESLSSGRIWCSGG